MNLQKRNTSVKPLSKEARWLLFNGLAQTHPDQDFRDWVDNPDRDDSFAWDELRKNGFIQEINGKESIIPRLGLAYFQGAKESDPTDTLKKIEGLVKQVRNPKFGVIVEGLSDTAILGLFYEILGEIGFRGTRTPEANDYWQNKLTIIQGVLTDTTPEKLFDRQKDQMQNF